ncbi:MAG: hypothetical protein P0Y49_07125 [Candidatus Pedobacter colombiensis]|uniref:Uncharacterized protein n=1 Tax=Candidatus Pedobacter colombiensis TaxID=3121371 RepID=A0AAJ5WE02_9SPHI|nr:hypothetical protein [Pedobacter sp.]WEK20907.1 MAG: hypothetical protein P0Y49_07125 [Pedobacter sp.]
MKKLIQPGLFFLACFFLICCKKNSAEKPVDTSYEVEYNITPLTNAFTKITYTDQTGTTIVINDITQFPGGVKKIKVLNKPFTAKMSVDINNQAPTAFSSVLSISVNGEVKKVQPISVPAFMTSTGIAEFTVN